MPSRRPRNTHTAPTPSTSHAQQQTSEESSGSDGRRASRRVTKRPLDADGFLALSLSPASPSPKSVDGDKENRKLARVARSASSTMMTMKGKGKASTTTSTSKPLPDILLLAPSSVPLPSPPPSASATNPSFPQAQPTRKRRRAETKEEATVTHTRTSKRLRGQSAPVPVVVPMPVIIGQSDESDVEEPIQEDAEKRKGRKRGRSAEGRGGSERSLPKSRRATATKTRSRQGTTPSTSPSATKRTRARTGSPSPVSTSPKATRSRTRSSSPKTTPPPISVPIKRSRTASSSSSQQTQLATRTRSRTRSKTETEADAEVHLPSRLSVEAESDTSDETLVDPDAEDPVPPLLNEALCEVEEDVVEIGAGETIRMDVNLADEIKETEGKAQMQGKEGKKPILELLSNVAKTLGPNPLVAVDSPSSVANAKCMKAYRALHAFPHPTCPQTKGEERSRVVTALVELMSEGLGERIQERRAAEAEPRAKAQKNAKTPREEVEMDVTEEQLPETMPPTQRTKRSFPLPVQSQSQPHSLPQPGTQNQRNTHFDHPEQLERYYEWDIRNFEFSFTPPPSPTQLPIVVPSSVSSSPSSLPPTSTTTLSNCNWSWNRWMAREPSRLRECVKARSRPGTPPPLPSSSNFGTSSGSERRPSVVLPSYAQRPPSSPSSSAGASASAMVHNLPLVDPTDSPPSSPPSPTHTLPFHSQPPALSLDDEEPSEPSQDFHQGPQPQQANQQQSQRLTEPALWKCASLSRVEQSCLIWGVETVRGWIERERVRWCSGSESGSPVISEKPLISEEGVEEECSSVPNQPREMVSEAEPDSQAVTSPISPSTSATSAVELHLDHHHDDADDGSDVDGEYEIDEEYYESLPPSPMSPSFASSPSPSSPLPTLSSSAPDATTSPDSSALEQPIAMPAPALMATPMSRTPSSSSISNLSDVEGIEDEEWDDIDVPGIPGPLELCQSGLADSEEEGESGDSRYEEDTESDEESEDDSDADLDEDDEGEGCGAFQVFIAPSAKEEDAKEMGGIEFAFRLDVLSPPPAQISRPLSSSMESDSESPFPFQHSSEREHDYDHDDERNDGMEIGPDELPRLLGLPALCLREPGQESLGLGTPAEAPVCATGSFAFGLSTPRLSEDGRLHDNATSGRKSAREEWMNAARRVGEECARAEQKTTLRDSAGADAGAGSVGLGLGLGLRAFHERQMNYTPSSSAPTTSAFAGVDVDAVMVDATAEDGLQLPSQMQMQLPASVDSIAMGAVAPIEPLSAFAVDVASSYSLEPGTATSLSLIPTDSASPSLSPAPLATNALSASTSTYAMMPDNSNSFSWGMLGFNVGFGVGVHVGFGLASAQQQHQVQQAWAPVEGAAIQTYGTLANSTGMGIGYVSPPPTPTPTPSPTDIDTVSSTPVYRW